MIYNKDSCLLAEDIESESVDSVVTDPPYAIHALGNSWDEVLPDQRIWDNCFRVLKPGSFLVSFGATRVYHRMAMQLETAGFEIVDCLAWLYASGFPRSLNISKKFDKVDSDSELSDVSGEYVPYTDNGKRWQGWGTVLKPAWEPIVLARKPFQGTYIDNLLKYQVGALNIDDCRIPYESEEDKKSLMSFLYFESKNFGDSRYFSMNTGNKKQVNVHPSGRWPANVLWLDPLFADYDKFFWVSKPGKKEKRDYNTHDTKKPVELMSRLITLVTPKPSVIGRSVSVLDPFMGSGTTGVAAKALNRYFYGYEINAEYFKIAQRRLEEKVEQEMFE